MPLPKPVPGLVIRYSYLWRQEFLEGREEGIKDRPCAIILVTETKDGDEIVSVLPITHSPPLDPALALEIPAATKRRLGLDGERSWIVLNEVNRFKWPGPDLRPIQNDAASVSYGILPGDIYRMMRERFVALVEARLARKVDRP
jgi:hypothetical protein